MWRWYQTTVAIVLSCLGSILVVLSTNAKGQKLTYIVKTSFNGSWCGDWTPHGSLVDPDYDPRITSTMHEAIPSCRGFTSDSREIKVGEDFEPNAELLFCQPDLSAHNRSNSFLALDLQRHPLQQPTYSLISPSHNVEQVLSKTVPLICQHTVGRWEIVFVIDASYDDSLRVIRDVLLGDICQSSSLIRARVLYSPTSIWETSSDNLGFTLAAQSNGTAPSHAYIEIQSDMNLGQYGWNRDLIRPLLEYGDIFSVSGRCAHSLRAGPVVGRCDDNVRSLDSGKQRETKDSVIVFQTNNRGPLAFRPDALKELGYLDEVNFYLGNDEHDLNRRAAFFGWYPAYKYVSFFAPLNQSPQRKKMYQKKTPAAVQALDSEYVDFRRQRPTNTSKCGRKYGKNMLDKPIHRPLQPFNFSDAEKSLPDLPPLAHCDQEQD